MEHALVIGASGGIGSAICARLKEQGVAVTGLSRRMDGIDLLQPATVQDVLSGLGRKFDLVFVATGGLDGAGHPPEKSLRALTAEAMMAQFALNAVGPALVLKHAPQLLQRDRRAVCAVLSARVGSIGDNRLGGWYSYRAAKAALNQLVHSASTELARSHPKAICVALHPGTVATSFTQDYTARHASVSPQTAAGNLLTVIDGLSLSQTGGFYDWAGKPVPW